MDSTTTKPVSDLSLAEASAEYEMLMNVKNRKEQIEISFPEVKRWYRKNQAGATNTGLPATPKAPAKEIDLDKLRSEAAKLKGEYTLSALGTAYAKATGFEKPDNAKLRKLAETNKLIEASGNQVPVADWNGNPSKRPHLFRSVKAAK